MSVQSVIHALPPMPERIRMQIGQRLSILGDRTRFTCTDCGEFIEIDCSPDAFEQAATSNPQPPWVRVVQDMIGGFLLAHEGSHADD